MDRISFCIPSYNNLKHLKNVYASIKRNEPDAEIILIDDASTDGTNEWVKEIQKTDKEVITFRTDVRVGHTILYDAGIELATNEIVGILHADMLIGPNYVKNILKHLKKGKVVCATRIEPPLHPGGKEKIIKNFGLDFNDLNIEKFESYCLQAQEKYKNQTTRGMFAPWVIYKEDFQRIGGHDPLFAPFPYEDSDIFQRWILKGYELIQSRDAFVYHLTCRGHRWTEEVGKDDDYFKIQTQRAGRNWFRKWGSWIKNDEYQYPIISPKYDIGFKINHCNLEFLELLEPWCSNLLIDDEMQVLTSFYLDKEQPNTIIDLSKKIKSTPFEIITNEIIVEINRETFTNQDFQFIQHLPDIIKDNGSIGKFEMGNLTIEIKAMNEYQNSLIKL
jgi:glycosyltransferase involved in cell wall biosynthesis